MAAPRNLLLPVLLLLLPPPPGAHGEVCQDSSGYGLYPKYCPVFCCGTCYNQYCCSDLLKKFVRDKESCEDSLAAVRKSVENVEQLASSLSFNSDMDSDIPGFGATVAVGVTIFVLFIVAIIACFTCSCCCLYKMCRRPRPVVTTTTSTTVVHPSYPQPPSMPPTYPGPSYQGYHPIAPQPGMAAAPYPAQYPPPYPAQPAGPPAYHETLAGGAATPYPPSQPPYNPAYMDPPKAAY